MTKELLRGKDTLDLFPNEIIEQSSQYHFWKHSIRTQVIYSIILNFLIFAVAALPFIYIDVGVTSRGIIRPEVNRKALISPVAGRITFLGLGENEMITKGDLVVELESSLLNNRLEANSLRQSEIEQYIRDLSYLTDLDSASIIKQKYDLESRIFDRSLIGFQQELLRSKMKIQNLEEKLRQQEYLYEREVISNAEFEESKYLYGMAVNRYGQLLEQRMMEWETELIQYQREFNDLKKEENLLKEEKSQYKIYMPVTGTVQNLSGIAEGGFLQLNQLIAEISPDTGLVVESIVPPGDIGLIVEGMNVYFKLDAFDYNQWGTVEGKVIDISDDILMDGNQPFFKVKSTLDRSFLELPNGTRGYLIKGMTLQARFKVTEQSLFHSLYQDVEDWLNPIWYMNE